MRGKKSGKIKVVRVNSEKKKKKLPLGYGIRRNKVRYVGIV